ncbi:3839_t:CDS:2 [Funneliformis geosporum]|uniref:3839_t:CDS:1 n=1 Tax=Funneliformis geosporum TaxID=1117311 RepID=A0A9W4SWU1_9GLOM|nr:3839_t:CDS:2 [Funneliformis geosporum]
MESERFNNTPLRVPLTDEEEFDPQYKSTLNRSILYYKIQPTASTNSQGESAQEKSETYSLCNEPDPLFEPNGAYLEPVEFWYIIIMKQTYSDTSAGDKIEVYKFLEALGLKTYTRWDYKKRFGEYALKKLYQTWEAHHRNIILMEFTRRLPNLSEEEKNGLFDIFFSSETFETKIHNALLDVLADPIKGSDLNNY